MPLLQTSAAPHGKLFPEPLVSPVGEEKQREPSAPPNLHSIMGCFVGATILILCHRNCKEICKMNMREKEEQLAHGSWQTELTIKEPQVIFLTSSFAHLQIHIRVVLWPGNSLGLDLPDSGPQKRYGSPKAQLAHIQARSSFTVPSECLLVPAEQKGW